MADPQREVFIATVQVEVEGATSAIDALNEIQSKALEVVSTLEGLSGSIGKSLAKIDFTDVLTKFSRATSGGGGSVYDSLKAEADAAAEAAREEERARERAAREEEKQISLLANMRTAVEGFARSIKGIVGPGGGTWDILGTDEADEFLDAMRRMQSRAGASFDEIKRDFREFDEVMAHTLGMDKAQFDRYLGKGFTSLVDDTEKTTRAMHAFWKWLYDELVGHSIIPDLVDRSGELMRDMTGSTSLAISRARDAVEELEKVIGGMDPGQSTRFSEWRDDLVNSIVNLEDAYTGGDSRVAQALERDLVAQLASIRPALERELGRGIGLSTGEISDSVQTTMRKVRNLIHEGFVDAEKIGGRWDATKSSLDDYLGSVSKGIQEHTRFVGVSDAMKRLNVSYEEFNRLVSEGAIKIQKTSGRVYTSSIERYEQSLDKAAQQTQEDFDRMQRSQQSWEDAADRTGLTFIELAQAAQKGEISIDKFGVITETSLRKFTTNLEKARVASQDFERLAVQAMHGIGAASIDLPDFAKEMKVGSLRDSMRTLNDGLEMIKSGNVLAGIRTGIFGIADSSSKASRALDIMTDSFGVREMDTFDKAMMGVVKTARALGKTFGMTEDRGTKAQQSFIETTARFQDQNVAMRNAVEAFKAYGDQHGIAGKEIAQVTQAIRLQTFAVRSQVSAALANKKLTAQGEAQLTNSIALIRSQVQALKEHIKTVGVTDEKYLSYIDTIDSMNNSAARMANVVRSKNAAMLEEEETLEEITEEESDRVGVLKKLTTSLGLTKEKEDELGDSIDQTSREAEESSESFGKMKRSVVSVWEAMSNLSWQIERLTGISIGEMFGAVFRKIRDQVSSIKDEFLGFGAVKGFTSQLTSGVTEFAAETRQAGFAVEFMGARLAEAENQDPATFVDFLNAKMVTLQEQGIGVAESIELVKNSLSIGFPLGGVNEATEAILDQGITLEQMIELYDSGKLGMETIGRAAQNWATVMGGSSSELAKKFVTASSRMSTEILETNNLGKNASTLWQDYADAMGIAVSEMTDQQKQAATLLGILQQTLPAAGAYEGAMGGIGDAAASQAEAVERLADAYSDGSMGMREWTGVMGDSMPNVETTGKLLGSMSRYVDNARLAIGDIFLPVLNKLALQLKGFLGTLTELAKSDAAQRLSESLARAADLFHVVGAPIRFLIENFHSLANMVATLVDAFVLLKSGKIEEGMAALKNGVIDGVAHIALFIQQKIGAALTWGWNLVANLANGVIQAAQTVLVSAANAVGNILGLFFAPGSPPKKGPLSEIDKWGEGLMDTFAGGAKSAARSGMAGVAMAAGEGMSGAMGSTFRDLELGSFKVIKDIMSPVRQIFQSMVGMGDMGESDMVPALQEARQELVRLADQFEETGEISDETLDSLVSKFGLAKGDMEEYIRLQFELKKAQEEVEESGDTTNLGEGAGFTTAGSRSAKEAARERVDNLKEQLDLVKERLDWQQEEKDLAQQQLQVLERIADKISSTVAAGVSGQQDQWAAFQESHERELAALERKKNLGLISEEEYQRQRLSLEQRYIDTAISMNKPLDQSRIDAFKALKEQVNSLTGGGGGAGGLGGVASDMMDIGDQMDGWIESAEGFEGVKETIGGATEEFAAMREKVAGVFDTVSDFLRLPFRDKIGKVADLLEGWTGLPITKWFESISSTVSETVTTVYNFFKWLYNILVGHSIIPDMIDEIVDLFRGVGEFVYEILEKIFTGEGISKLLKSFGKLAESVVHGVKKVVEIVKGVIASVSGSAQSGVGVISSFSFDELAASIGDTLNAALEKLADIVQIVSTALSFLFDTIVRPAISLISGLVSAVVTLASRLYEMESLRRLLNRIWNLLKIIGAVTAVVVAGFGALVLKGIDMIGRWLEPAVNLLANFIDSLAKKLIVAIDLVVGPVEFLFELFTSGPSAAMDVLERLGNDIKVGFIPIVLALSGVMKVAFAKNLIKSFGEAIMNNAQLLKFYAQYAVSGVVDAFRRMHIWMSQLTFSQVTTGISNMASSIGTKLTSAITFLVSPTGLLVAGLAALAAVSVNLLKTLGEIEDKANEAKGAIGSWSGEARVMAADGQSASDMVDEFAGRINNAREAFDSSPWAGVLASGKDIELFNESAKEMDDILKSQANTYEEYNALVDQWNEKTDVQEMNIIGITEAEFDRLKASDKLAQAVQNEIDMAERQNRETSEWLDNTDEAVGLVRQLDTQNRELASAIRSGNTDLANRITAQRDANRAVIMADSFLSDLAQREGVLTGAIDETNASMYAREGYAREMSSAMLRHWEEAEGGVRTAIGGITSTVEESGAAEAFSVDLTRANTRVGELLDEQSTAYDQYQTERNQKISEYDAQMITLREQGKIREMEELTSAHNAELAEIDRRYAEEAQKRKNAIAESLLDLNEKIMQEKLMQEGVTGVEALAIVQQHKQQAQEIIDLYGADIDAMRRFSDQSAEALQGAALTYNDYVTAIGSSSGEVLGILRDVQERGFGGLSTRQQETLTQFTLGIAQMKVDAGATKDELVNILGVLPQEVQDIALRALDEGQKLNELDFSGLSSAIDALDKKVEPEIDVVVEYKRGRAAEFGSPKTKLQYALEDLVNYAANNPVSIAVELTKGAIEYVEGLAEGMGFLVDAAGTASTMLDKIGIVIYGTFQTLERRITGPAGAVTMMISGIKDKFYSLTSTYAFLGSFSSQITSMMIDLVNDVVSEFGTLPGKVEDAISSLPDKVRTVVDSIPDGISLSFSPGGHVYISMYSLGEKMMKALVDGASSVSGEIVATLTVNDPGGGGDDDEGDDQGFVPPPNFITSPVDIPTTVDWGAGRVGGSVPGETRMFFERGAFEGAFPNITSGDEAQKLVNGLNELTSRGMAYGRATGN